MSNLTPRVLSCCRSLPLISMSRLVFTASNSCSLLHPAESANVATNQNRFYNGWIKPLRPKYPFYHLRKERAVYYENISKKNREFVSEMVEETYGPKKVIHGVETYDVKSPLQKEPFERGSWNIKSQRTGVIARKIGIYPLWNTKGERIVTTLLQVADNHVLRYIPPEEFNPPKKPYDCIGHKKNLGCLLVGADSTDPQRFTKEYCGLFTTHGMMPKRRLARFLITPEAVIQPGTPLYANHFKIGQCVDVRGITIARGFEGVMKRHGFHGMPATHGQTKTHRRPGCIGRGRNYRVQPGKKLPGHVGFRWRTARGIQIVRINTKYNVLYIKGRAIPGETGAYVYIYDTNVTHKLWNHQNQPVFPTFYPEEQTEPLPEDIYAPDIYDFSQPTIMYEVPVEKKKRRK